MNVAKCFFNPRTHPRTSGKKCKFDSFAAFFFRSKCEIVKLCQKNVLHYTYSSVYRWGYRMPYLWVPHFRNPVRIYAYFWIFFPCCYAILALIFCENNNVAQCNIILQKTFNGLYHEQLFSTFLNIDKL